MKNRPLFQQNLNPLMETGLINRQSYLKAYKEASWAMGQVEKRAEQGEYSFLEDPFLPLDKAQPILRNFQDLRMILIMGSKRSIVAVRALSSLLQSWVWVEESRPRLCFLDELDPEAFWEVMSIAHPSSTGVIVLGDVVDEEVPLLQLMRCLEYWQGMISSDDLQKHFLIIPFAFKENLEKIRSTFGLSHFDGSPYIYFPSPSLSCFSLPLLIPVMVAGFNAQKFHRGAALTCAQFFRRQLKIPLEGAALLWAVRHAYNLSYHVFYPMREVFEFPLTWMRYVWKENFPNPPYHAIREPLSSVRHFFTVFSESRISREPLDPVLWSTIPEVRTLAQLSLGEWLDKNCQNFCQKKIQEGHLLRTIKINTLNEETLGALLMNHMLEILIMKELYQENSKKKSS